MATKKIENENPTRMSIQHIVQGKRKQAWRALFYGPEGVGKTSLAADIPNAIFLDTEDGSGQVNVSRFPAPESYEDILGAIESLETESHKFETLVIDTGDRIEAMIWDHICKSHGKHSVEDFGYGKGYVLALGTWRELLIRLDSLRKSRDMNIVFLGHSHIRTFKNPEGEDWDRYQLRLHDKSAGQLKEWCDVVGFCQYEQTTKADQKENAKGFATGARVLYLQRSAAYDAKSRWPMPPRIPLSWNEFDRSLQAGQVEDIKLMNNSITVLMEQMSEPLKNETKTFLQKADDDPVRIAKLLNWARGKIQEEARG